MKDQFGITLETQEDQLNDLNDYIQSIRQDFSSKIEELRNDIKVMGQNLDKELKDKSTDTGFYIDRKEKEMYEKTNIIFERINKELDMHRNNLERITKINTLNEGVLREYEKKSSVESDELREILKGNEENDIEVHKKVVENQNFLSTIEERFLQQTFTIKSAIGTAEQKQDHIVDELRIVKEKAINEFAAIRKEMKENSYQHDKLLRSFDDQVMETNLENRNMKEIQGNNDEALKQVNQTQKFMEQEIKVIKKDVKTHEKDRQLKGEKLDEQLNHIQTNQVSNGDSLRDLENQFLKSKDLNAKQRRCMDDFFKDQTSKITDNEKSVEENMMNVQISLSELKTEVERRLSKDLNTLEQKTREGLYALHTKITELIGGDISNTTR